MKEAIVKEICDTYCGCFLLSYSNAPSVLFASNDLPAPYVFKINPFNDNKLYLLVGKWVAIAAGDSEYTDDASVLTTFEKIQAVFAQTEVEKYPYTAVTFLELIDSISGSDIAFSSFAACYDTMINNRLTKAGISWKNLDESKNFLSLIAYHAYSKTGSNEIDFLAFDECLSIFEDQYFSSQDQLRKSSIDVFLRTDATTYSFFEDYIWFFLCARYVVKNLQANDIPKYTEFVDHCTQNIFQKKFANIVIYIAYFSNDNLVLYSLLKTVDGLFSRANDWVISDDLRELMIGLTTRDQLLLQAQSDVNENRMSLLQEKVVDMIADAEKVVARYTLPFLSHGVADSKYVQGIDRDKIDADSYMESVNALLRVHSVIGQILGARTGTYSAKLILDCITRMVEASGRYVSLNHAIATVLIYDKEKSLEHIKDIYKSDKLSDDERYEKVIRIFSFWSVYLSHAGLARYLSQEHSIRALEKLTVTYEADDSRTKNGNIPFNFAFVLLVARLYHTGKIDREEIEEIIKKYGKHSAVLYLLRVVLHIYAYYMPLKIEDKQWISDKLGMSLKKIETQSYRANDARVKKIRSTAERAREALK